VSDPEKKNRESRKRSRWGSSRVKEGDPGKSRGKGVQMGSRGGRAARFKQNQQRQGIKFDRG